MKTQALQTGQHSTRSREVLSALVAGFRGHMAERAAEMQLSGTHVRRPCRQYDQRSQAGRDRLHSLLRASPTLSAGLPPERDSDTLQSRLAGNWHSWTSLETGRCVETWWEPPVFQGPSGQKEKAWSGFPEGSYGQQIPAQREESELMRNQSGLALIRR